MLFRILHRMTAMLSRSNSKSAQSFLIENLPHIVFKIDAKFCWLMLNHCWERVTDIPRTDSIGVSYKHYIHPEDIDNLQNYLQSLHHQQQDNETVEARLLTRSGEFRWVEIHAVLIIDESGSLIRIGTMTDITECIAEEELLHANNRSLSSLLNDLSGMMYRCRNDKNWTMEYLSGGCKELTGFQPADMINNFKVPWSSLIHYEDRDMVWAEVQNGIRQEKYFDMIYRMHTIDGQLKWVWERGKGIFSDDGELLGLEGYITDITAEKLQQDRLLNEQLYNSQLGLPHLPLFRDRLSQTIKAYEYSPKNIFSLLIVQFHKLTEAFDRYGEPFQTRTMIEISRRLRHISNDTDSITCIKPDRYAILIDRNYNPDYVTYLAGKILEKMRAPIRVNNKTLFMLCNIGCAGGNNSNNSVDNIIHNAVVAMEYASAQGGSRFECYDPAIIKY